MDAPDETSFSYEIVDSPGQQTAKQAILWNEANLDALLAAYNAHTHADVDTDDLAAAAKTGSDTKVVTGTDGTDGNLAEWNADGDLVDGPTPPSGTIIGTTDTQTLTNKTIDADSNTISNLEHGSEVDNPTSGVHGVTGSVVGTSDTQTLTNKTIAVANNTLSGLEGLFAGLALRTRAEFKDTDEIYLYPARYHHNGTVEQIVRWDSKLTFQFGSAGSNASSEDLGASEWHFLYIDDSALSGAVITSARLYNSTTAPTWSDAKHGHYNGNDKCIRMFRTNGSSQLIEFTEAGGLHEFSDSIESQSIAALTASFVTKTLDGPALGSPYRIMVTLNQSYNSAGAALYYRTTDVVGTSGHIVSQVNAGTTLSTVRIPVICNGDSQIDVKGSATGTNLSINTDGYFIPDGM